MWGEGAVEMEEPTPNLPESTPSTMSCFLEVLPFYGVKLSDPQSWSRGRRACLRGLKSLLFCFACPPSLPVSLGSSLH